MRLNEIANPNLAPGMAYWISPRGEILDIAGQMHIQTVIERPEKFGLTKEYIDKLYADFDEPMGTEGKAREQIILALVKRGWIRTRLYRKQYFWAMNINRMTNVTYDNIIKWAKYHTERTDIGKQAGNFADVKLSKGDEAETKDIGQLIKIADGQLKEAFIIEDDGGELITLSVVESVHDMIGESSLGRIFQHLDNPNRPVAFITAFRGGQENRHENLRRNRQLAGQVKKAGYGYTFIDGGWIENQGTPEEQKVEEDTVFIVGNENDSGNLKGLVKKLMVQYDQDGVLFKPAGGNEVHLLLNSGENINLGKFTMGTAEEGYSRIRGREFHFESTREPRKNWISNIAAAKGVK